MPDVAGAFLMTRTALARLYPQDMPVAATWSWRLRQALDEGVTGVIASVAGLMTGANEGGFKGLAGRLRDGRLRFGVPMTGMPLHAASTARRTNWRIGRRRCRGRRPFPH